MIKDKLKGKTMTDQLATLTTDEDVSIITLDDGKANVFSTQMSETLNSLLDQVPEDKGSLLITGKPGLFSAGFDLKTISGGDPKAAVEMTTAGFRLLSRFILFQDCYSSLEWSCYSIGSVLTLLRRLQNRS